MSQNQSAASNCVKQESDDEMDGDENDVQYSIAKHIFVY